MDSFTFEIQGVTARIHSSCPEGHETLAALERDFAAFGRGGEANIQIEICAQTPVQTGAANFPLPVFQTSVLKVCGWFNHRVCIYSGDVVAEARSSRGRRLFWISGQDRNLVREVTYKFLLSAIGEALDIKGLHRVHAFGFKHADRTGLLLAPSGRGKSALASLLCLKERGFSLFSDESPLLRRRSAELLPFPTRISIAPEVAEALELGPGELYLQKNHRRKALYPFPIAKTASASRVDIILRGQLSAFGEPRIFRCSGLRLFPGLFGDIVVGLGLAQMAEWMLRVHALPRLVRISFGRVGALFSVLLSAKSFYIFSMSKDARANADCLERFYKAGNSAL